jgi:hypothetical protein
LTIANDILFLALRNGGITGIGQIPDATDINDSFKVLNAWISELNLERRVMVNTVVLPPFPDLTTDVSFWTPYEHVLLTSMSVRLRQIYALPPVDLDVQLALSALQAFQAINLQQIPVSNIDTLSGLGFIFAALRAAGRLTDKQSVDPASQDVSDAHQLMIDMVEEWTLERTVRVIPGLLPDLRDMVPELSLDPGMRNAIVLNLAVRLRDLWGQEVPSTLQTRADRALQLVQAINAQQIAPLATGVPATVRQACVLALRLAGRINDQQRVSDTSTDMNDATSLLVMMLGQWQRKRWLVWNEAETAKVSTGSQWYSVGPGGDFNMPRPDKLHGGFVRFQPFAGPNPVDIPLAIIEAKEDWGKITIKDLKSIPEVMFYDSAFPMGRVTFYPVPPANDYELHIFTKAQLPVYVNLTDQLLVPPEYLDAIVNNLALRLPGAQITPLLLGQARASLETIRLANAQISTLSLPGILGGRGGDVSSWSGRGLNRAWIVGSEAVL